MQKLRLTISFLEMNFLLKYLYFFSDTNHESKQQIADFINSSFKHSMDPFKCRVDVLTEEKKTEH